MIELKNELNRAREEIEASKERARYAEQKLKELQKKLVETDETKRVADETLKLSEEKLEQNSIELQKMRQEAADLKEQACNFEAEVRSIRELKDLEVKKLRQEIEQSKGMRKWRQKLTGIKSGILEKRKQRKLRKMGLNLVDNETH